MSIFTEDELDILLRKLNRYKERNEINSDLNYVHRAIMLEAIKNPSTVPQYRKWRMDKVNRLEELNLMDDEREETVFDKLKRIPYKQKTVFERLRRN